MVKKKTLIKKIAPKKQVSTSSAPKNELLGIKKTLKEHSQVLDRHGKTLDKHSKILDEHTKILDGHTKILDEHSKKFVRIEKKLEEHDAHFVRIEKKLEEHDVRLDKLTYAVVDVQGTVHQIQEVLTDLYRDFRASMKDKDEQTTVLNRHDVELVALSSSRERHEERIAALEKKAA